MDDGAPSPTTETMPPSKVKPDGSHSILPPLPLNLSEHKISITLHIFPIILASGILPLVLYFTLRHTTTLSLTIILTIALVPMGVVSFFAFLQRSWRLFRQDSNCRPLVVDGRWGGDFFHWNFLFGLILLTTIISIGIGVGSVVLCSLPLSILLLYVSLELLLAQIAKALGWKTPIRMSSLPRGSATRSGTFVIVEDVVAVDGGLGREWRGVWGRRYEVDAELRGLLGRLDLVWGVSGLCVVVVIWGIVFGVGNKEVGYAVGWGLPWVWAGDVAFITVWIVKRMLRRQGRGLEN